MTNKKYTIDCGFGMQAVLYTPYPCKERFYTLANVCYGVKKYVVSCHILKEEEVDCDDFERLEFNGDIYVWREDGAMKKIKPDWVADDSWDTDFRDICKYRGGA